MAFTFDVKNVNLFTVRNFVYIGLNYSELIPASECINEIISENIGELKVRQSDVEVALEGHTKARSECFVVPLKELLDAYNESNDVRKYTEDFGGVTNTSASLLGFAYTIHAETFENSASLDLWSFLKKQLSDPAKYFDKFEEKRLLTLDREKSLELMQSKFDELDKDVPDNFARFYVMDGLSQITENDFRQRYLGVVFLDSYKAEDDSVIDKVKAELCDKLQVFKGPALSLSAPIIFETHFKAYFDAENLVNDYGEVLFSPNWKKKIFRFG